MDKTENLDRILDIPVSVTAQLSKTKMDLGDILQLGQGSIIELDKLAGEPLEILVGKAIVGKAEVVVSNERYAVRIVEISTPQQRIENLGI